MAQILDSFTGFANQFNSAAAERRKRLAESLAQTGQQTFAMANPFILEDLNSRGLFTSGTARDQSQTEALKQISLQNQQQLSDFDTDVFNQGQGILSSGMAGDLQRQMDEADQAQEQAMAERLGKQQSRDAMLQSLIGAGGQLGAASLLTKGLGGMAGDGGGMLASSAGAAGVAGGPSFASPLNLMPGGPGSTLPTPTSGLGKFLGGAGSALGAGASVYGGAALGQGLGRSMFGQKGLNDRSTSRGVKAGALAGAGLGTYFGGPLGGLAGGALGSAVGGVAGKGVREIGKGVKAVVKKPLKAVANFHKAPVKAVGKAFKSLCFSADTPIVMADGSEVPIQHIGLGAETKGGMVESVRLSLTADGTIYSYRGVTVTGSHAVLEGGEWKRVESSEQARPISGTGIVYSLVTTGHRIYAKGVEFADEFECDEYEELTMEQSLDKLNERALEVV